MLVPLLDVFWKASPPLQGVVLVVVVKEGKGSYWERQKIPIKFFEGLVDIRRSEEKASLDRG